MILGGGCLHRRNNMGDAVYILDKAPVKFNGHLWKCTSNGKSKGWVSMEYEDGTILQLKLSKAERPIDRKWLLLIEMQD